MLLALLALLLAAQDDELKSVTITKQERSIYLPAVNKFKEAEKLLESDPAGAIEKCTEVLDEKNVKEANREVKIRIQNSDGTYGDWYVFVPYQLRGRARLARAKSLGTKARGDAIQMAQDAIKDLDESTKRGANSSKAYVKEAVALITKLKEGGDTTPDPRVERAEKFMKELRTLVDAKADPDAVLKKCAAIAADVKATPFENELNLIRERAEKAKTDAGRTATDKAMADLREFVKGGAKPADIVKRCDALEPKIKGTAFESELKLIREKAVDALAESRSAIVEAAMKDLRGFVKSAPGFDAIIKRCDEMVETVKGTPWESELSLIRERAVKDRDSAKSASAADKAIAELREFVKSKPGAEAVLKKCADLGPALEGTAYDGELKLTRKSALEERFDTFRRKWAALCDDERFKSALKLIEADGAFLEDDQRKSVKDDTAKRSRAALDAKLDRFQRNLKDLLPPDTAVGSLGKLPAAEFSRQLSLPDDAELIETDPSLAWGRAFRTLLEKARAETPLQQKAPEFLAMLEKATATAAAAVPLKADGENRCFAAAEAFAYDLARRRLEEVVSQAISAGADIRRERQADAIDIIKRMKELSAKVDEALSQAEDKGETFRRRHDFLPVHLKTLESSLDRFPVDVARIDEIGAAIGSLEDEAPLVALEMHEKELARILKTEGSRLTRESRQKLGTWLLIAAATRHLLAGAKPADVAKRDEIRDYAKVASDVGGPLADAVKKAGPKVAKVLELAK